MLWLASLLSLSLAQAQGNSSTAGPLSKRLVHQFPNGTWIENLVIRPNGFILATQATAPNLYVVNPFTGAADLLYTFPDAEGLSGITQVGEDVFYVAVGNSSIPLHSGVQGSWSLWQIDYSPKDCAGPVITKWMNLPNQTNVDGITTLDANRGLILGADISQGNVFRVDLKALTSNVAIKDPLLLPSPTKPTGVNGVKIRDRTLFFTNTGINLIGKVPIDSDGNALSNASVVQPFNADDFTFDHSGNILSVAGKGNLTETYAPSYSQYQGLLSFPGPTSCQFGRTAFDSGCLYVTTTGNDSAYEYRTAAPIAAGGAVYAVDLFKNGSCPSVQ